jgi:lysophospholipase L1-like esterase
MKKIYKFFLIVLFFSNSLTSQEVLDQDKNEPRTILFIGNSYLYYGDSLHNHFKRMAEEYLEDYDGSASVKSATIGGSRLKHHDVERLIMPKAISSIEKFDLVILQGGSSESLTQENRKKFSYYAKKHIESIKANNSKAALYMTHAFVEPHKDFEENQIRVIQDFYTKVGEENNVLVIPVGLAFDIAYKEFPGIKLHHIDGTHPNLKGTYLAACTVFASIYGESPIGLKYDYYGAINKNDKILLQKIADKATSIYFKNNN